MAEMSSFQGNGPSSLEFRTLLGGRPAACSSLCRGMAPSCGVFRACLENNAGKNTMHLPYVVEELGPKQGGTVCASHKYPADIMRPPPGWPEFRFAGGRVTPNGSLRDGLKAKSSKPAGDTFNSTPIYALFTQWVRANLIATK